MRYLTFQLYGPLQSYGDVAVGELRPTRAMPTRSALCGLVAAALGIRRSDAADLAGIRDGYDIGVAQVRAGSSLRDFHTVQAASTGAKKTFYCRRDEMADSDVNTLVSFRDYLENAFFLVCLGERACAPFFGKRGAGTATAALHALSGTQRLSPGVALASRAERMLFHG